MLKKFIACFIALGAIEKVRGEVNYTELCLEKAPDPDDAGFVCLSSLSAQYLRCHLPEKVAFMMECANGTVCSYEVGKWTIDNPCLPGTTPTCGNGVIEEGEECEVGGVGCDPETCKCTEEFVPASPAATDCLKRNRCGDGVLVVEEGEECEAGGLGCSSECKCLPGYIAASSVDCTADDDVPLKDICESLTESPDDSGYVCLSEDSGEYLRCHLTEKVATMMACAAGTRCKAPVGVFQVYNPCLWESYSEYPEIFQHGSSSEAQKQHRKARSDDDNDDDSSAYVPVNHNYSVYCKLFGKAGYYCARQINPQARSDEFVYCDTNGNYAYQLTCAKGSYCALDGFSEENPCTGRSHLSSDSDEATCGNGVLEAGEECEAGAFGCDEEICACKHGFFPSADLDGSCFLNYTVVCEMIWKYARNGSSVSAYYFCPSFYDPRSNSSAVVECPASGVANYNACPTDKFCTSTGLASENPCVSAAPQCGNGKLEAGEECEAGGVGCNPETCKCKNGYHPASDDDEDGEPSVNCIKDVEPKPTANYSELCEGFKIPGYFCAAVFNKSETDAKAIQCGANGAFSGTFNCPAGTTCRSKGFTIYNPCNPPVDSSSEDDDGNKDSSSSLCGGKRECSGGGKGCNEKGCTCLPGFKPTVPPSVNCELNDYSKVCLSHGLGKNTTLATCLDGYTATFLICSSDGAADSFMAPCPPGTGCTAVGTPINGMPCTRDED